MTASLIFQESRSAKHIDGKPVDDGKPDFSRITLRQAH
jgi:hypothetical protein